MFPGLVEGLTRSSIRNAMVEYKSRSETALVFWIEQDTKSPVRKWCAKRSVVLDIQQRFQFDIFLIPVGECAFSLLERH